MGNVAMKLCLTLLVALVCAHTASALPARTGNFLLDNEFCKHYYPTDGSGGNLPPCEDIKNMVKPNTTTALPILELGDPSRPGMFFIHGWPDSAAEWAPQMAHFCGPKGRYHCVAVSWTNFDPDVPMAPQEDLRFQKAIDKIKLTMEQVGFDVASNPKKDTTLHAHDWGAFVGYQVIAQYPTLTNRNIFYDIGAIGSTITNTSYQAVNREAYIAKDSSISIANAVRLNVPSPTFATWDRSWPYCMEGATPSCGFNSFEGLNAKPVPYDKPMMFLYGTRATTGGPRPADNYFFGKGWLEKVQSTPHGETVAVPSDHWMHVRAAGAVNGAVEGWLESLSWDPK